MPVPEIASQKLVLSKVEGTLAKTSLYPFWDSLLVVFVLLKSPLRRVGI